MGAESVLERRRLCHVLLSVMAQTANANTLVRRISSTRLRQQCVTQKGACELLASVSPASVSAHRAWCCDVDCASSGTRRDAKCGQAKTPPLEGVSLHRALASRKRGLPPIIVPWRRIAAVARLVLVLLRHGLQERIVGTMRSFSSSFCRSHILNMKLRRLPCVRNPAPEHEGATGCPLKVEAAPKNALTTQWLSALAHSSQAGCRYSVDLHLRPMRHWLLCLQCSGRLFQSATLELRTGSFERGATGGHCPFTR